MEAIVLQVGNEPQEYPPPLYMNSHSSQCSDQMIERTIIVGKNGDGWREDDRSNDGDDYGGECVFTGLWRCLDEEHFVF